MDRDTTQSRNNSTPEQEINRGKGELQNSPDLQIKQGSNPTFANKGHIYQFNPNMKQNLQNQTKIWSKTKQKEDRWQGKGKVNIQPALTKFKADNYKVRLITNELNPEIANIDSKTKELNIQILKIASYR